jgi:hypothetical protein
VGLVSQAVHVDAVLQMPEADAQGHAGLRPVRAQVLRSVQGRREGGMKFQIELTGSEMMALRTILVTYMHFEPGTVHADCSEDPVVETTAEDLLALLMQALPVNHKVSP